MRNHSIGIDLGGTKTEVIVLDPTGNETFRERSPTPRDKGYDGIVDNVVAMIELGKSRLPGSVNFHLGIGIPGVVDSQTDRVIKANTTALKGKPLKADLEKKLNHKIAIENDANCFAIAEAKAGAGVGYDIVFGVIMGTGCGGGIVLNGNVHHGMHGIAGEWGHMSIDPEGLQCFCGNIGCIETKISGSGVERNYEKRTGEKRSMNDIVLSARQGEDSSKEIMNEFLEDFGRSLGGLISILDPDAIILGGGLSNIDELYTEGIERIKKHAFYRDIRTPILKNRLGDSAGVIGAAWIGIL